MDQERKRNARPKKIPVRNVRARIARRAIRQLKKRFAAAEKKALVIFRPPRGFFGRP
jgi:hypothetical protein